LHKSGPGYSFPKNGIFLREYFVINRECK